LPTTYLVNIPKFEQIIGIVKDVRTGTIIGRGSISLAFADASAKRFESEINVAAQNIQAIPAM
jgi:hypothetical protein